jgi:amino acid transporter
MKTRYGFYTLTFLVIANMIGAGVFTTSGYSLASLGSPWIVILAWVVGGLIATAGAASYGMLSRVMPESGGEYLFLSRAAHPLLGYIAGWVSLLAGFSGAIAFAAVTLEQYLIPQELRPAWLPGGGLAIAAIILSALVHGLRPRFGALTQNVAVLLKLILLATIFTVAAYQIASTPASLNVTPSELSQHAAGQEGLVPWGLIFAFAGSLVWISLSYSGFNAAVYVAGEVENPQHVIPRALITGTILVAVIYVLLNAIFVLGPPADQIAGQAEVAAIAAHWLGGARLEEFVRWTISLCLLTSVFSMMMAAPRVYAKMAEDGLLPGWLRFQGDSPWSATIAQAIVAIGLVLMSDLQGLLTYLGLTLSLSAACSVGCLFLPGIQQQLRSQRPAKNDSAPNGLENGLEKSGSVFRHWHLAAPAFYLLATLLSAAIMTSKRPQDLIGTLVTFAVGAIAYAIARYRQAGRAGSDF